MRPRIGITVHVEQSREGPRYALAGRYAAAVAQAGGLPLLLPTDGSAAAPPEQVIEAVDGLVLSGGGGDHRRYFTAGASPTLRATNPERYDYEFALIRAAWARHIPILGICRGCQTIAEALGGKLIDDLKERPSQVEHSQQEPAAVATHTLVISPQSQLHRWVGAAAKVNSFHRQGVAQVPVRFIASAWAEDGLIEAFEAEAGFVLAVQFHPEWLAIQDPRFLSIFAALISHARKDSY